MAEDGMVGSARRRSAAWRWGIRIVGGLFGFVILCVIGAVALVHIIDWNAYRPRIASEVRDATGRELTLDTIDVSVLPKIRVSLTNVSLSNAPDALSREMLGADRIDGEIGLWPLFVGTLAVDRFVVEKPRLNLEVNEHGEANWVFRKPEEPGESDGGENEPSREQRNSGGAGLPFDEITLGDVSIVDGGARFDDVPKNQIVEATDINLTASLPTFDARLTSELSMILNDEAVTFTAMIDSPEALLEGDGAAATIDLKSPLIAAAYDGGAQTRPLPGLNGEFTLDIPSVGQLADWLGQPFEGRRGDPGPLMAEATFAAAGERVAIERATLTGDGLEAHAVGSVDISGGKTQVVATVESGVIDIDRYLPVPLKAVEPAAETVPMRANTKDASSRDPLATLSDDDFDLDHVRQLDADISVKVDGVKVQGFEVGRIDLDATAKQGIIAVLLNKLELYGGGINSDTRLDATRSDVAITTDTQIAQVDVGALARAATRKEPQLVGQLDAAASFAATGDSPRALAQSLAGQLTADLGGIDATAAAGLTELDATVRLDGVDVPPQIVAGAVYNRETVTVNVTTDPLKAVLGEDRFNADVAVASRLLDAAYEGAVLREPAPGLDGNFRLDVTSVAELARWLGQSLPENQPDPGPLAVRATFAGSGETVRLEEATIEGRALRARASGEFDAEPTIPEFSLSAVVDEADLNAYLPKSSGQAKSAQKSPSQGGSSGVKTGWSEDPIDFSALGKANGEAAMDFANVKYKDLVVEKGQATVTLRDRVFDAVLDDVQTAEGSIAAEAGVDASEPAAAVRYTASIANVQARPLLGGLEITDRIGGALTFTTKGKAQGRSEKELVSTLNGDGGFKFEDGAVYGVNLAATLRRARTLGISSSAAETQKTDFAELSGTFQITDGVLENRDLKMLAPLVRLSGAGTVPMPPRTVDYHAEAKLVGSLQGQGSADSLSGIPIPIHITGSWDKPAYNVDWNAVFRSVDPEDLANMPAELQDRAKDLGIDLPVDDIPGLDSIPDSTQDKVKDTLKNLFGR